MSSAQPYYPNPGHLYDDDSVPTVRIEIDSDSLDAILTPGNELSDHEYPATFLFSRGGEMDTVSNVGFRLRGNTSRYAQKKSFKVSFNTFESGRKYHGVEKLNLNGEHNDPSIIRSKICWDLFREFRVPASRANHVMLYINGMYFGLYISVEHIDENFVDSRFDNNSGNLYKCLWPADLAYLGDDPDAYKLMSGDRRVYELKTNEAADDYSDLAHFISIVNTTPDSSFAAEIQRVFNVNKYLRIMAVDAAVGSWDNYWYLKNNYYLYHNSATGKFEFIPYDYDNTFGIWWNGIEQGVDWGTRDVYTWGNQNEARPLTERILEVPEFRARYSYYLNELARRTSYYFPIFSRIDSLHTMISQAAEEDSFRTLDYGYTFYNFNQSYTQPLGVHVTYGLKEFISTRKNNILYQVDLSNIAPIIEELQYSPTFPHPGGDVSVSVWVEDEAANLEVLLHFRIDDSVYTPIEMSGDQGNPHLYSGVIPIPESAGEFRFYVSASDTAGLTSTEPFNAPESWYKFHFFGDSGGRLCINEFMADNETIITDESGDYEDWLELYNADTVSVWLGDMYLTDDLDSPEQWALPDTTLSPGEFLLIWADDDEDDGALHTNFKLDKDGEEIGLFRNNTSTVALVDSIRFGTQREDESYGRFPDGGEAWQFMPQPSPGEPNTVTSIDQNRSEIPSTFQLYQNYPNPFNGGTQITFGIPERSRTLIRIINLRGQAVRTFGPRTYDPGRYQISWDGAEDTGAPVSTGVYFYVLVIDNKIHQTRKMVLMK